MVIQIAGSKCVLYVKPIILLQLSAREFPISYLACRTHLRLELSSLEHTNLWSAQMTCSPSLATLGARRDVAGINKFSYSENSARLEDGLDVQLLRAAVIFARPNRMDAVLLLEVRRWVRRTLTA